MAGSREKEEAVERAEEELRRSKRDNSRCSFGARRSLLSPENREERAAHPQSREQDKGGGASLTEVGGASAVHHGGALLKATGSHCGAPNQGVASDFGV